MIRILIADDHAVVRRGVVQLLKEDFKTAHFGEAATAPELLEKARQGRWDLIILDIGLPGRGGLDLLREIKSARVAPPVLIHSMYPEEQFAVRAIKAGASGYLAKESAPEKLAQAVRKILGGGRYISDSLADQLAVEVAADTSRPVHELLSDREFTVLRLLASGKTVKEIAGELSLSVKTVSTYRARILEKTGMRTTAELMRYAIERKLSPFP
jgi:DNA-binding NarL/FixJ family response regulator